MMTNDQKANEQAPLKKTVAVVLGMHRSGTSAMAGVLAGLGVNFGSVNNLIGALSEVNAKGFWEHREIVMLNEELLTALGSSWDDVRGIDPKLFKLAGVCEIKENIKTVLRRDFLNLPLWGLKDPRLCKLLPVWLDIFKEIDVTPQFFIVYRHPVEVARSLEKRDGLLLEKAYALWLSYVFPSELFSRGFPRTFIAYDCLLDNWRSTMKRALSELYLFLDNDFNNFHSIDSFLSPELRHMVSNQESLKGHGSEWVQAVYERLLAYSKRTSDDMTIMEDIDQIRKNFQIGTSLFAPMIFDQNSVYVELGVLRKEQSNLIINYERSREAYEQTKETCDQISEAYEQTKEAYDHISGAYEQTKEACDHISGAYEQTKKAYEQTKEACDHISGAYEQTNEACDQTKMELESIKKKFGWRICNKLGL